MIKSVSQMLERKVLTIKKASVALVTIVTVILFLGHAGLAANYRYDNLHRLTRVVYDNGLQISYTYDAVGNRTQRVSTLLADASVDGTVNFYDFALLASRWMEEDCVSPDWCNRADINWSTAVDFQDLTFLAQQWLEGIAP